MLKTDLSAYNHNEYHPGHNALIRTLWYFVNVLFFINPLNPISSLKVLLLKLFGSKIGKNAVIKPSVNIKFPWRLTIGNNVWIGENVWIDNLDNVEIGDNCCLSQGAMLQTASHDCTRPFFNIQTAPIILEEGVWIGTRALVCMGVVAKSHAVLAANSVSVKDMEAYSIYYGKPATKGKDRVITN